MVGGSGKGGSVVREGAVVREGQWPLTGGVRQQWLGAVVREGAMVREHPDIWGLEKAGGSR